jgi:hypothetical protein
MDDIDTAEAVVVRGREALSRDEALDEHGRAEIQAEAPKRSTSPRFW